MLERTLVLIKPDGVRRGLVGEVISRLEKRGFRLLAMQMRVPDQCLLTQHYAELTAQPFFPGIIEYMTSGPVVALVVEGVQVINAFRNMAGATMPTQAAPGTIRGDLAQNPVEGAVQNIVHGSDSVQSANREISLWFPEFEDSTNNE